MMQPILYAKDVVKRYGKFQAVSGVTLCVQPHTIHSVIGPNGVGKATLFHTLTGTVPLTSGSILLNDKEVAGLADYERVQLGMARSFQVTSLFQTLTVRENLKELFPKECSLNQALHFGPRHCYKALMMT